MTSMTIDQITGAMFDMDGTILDSGAMWDQIPLRILEAAGRTPSPTLLQELQPLGMHEYAPILKREYQLPQSEAEIDAEVVRMAAQYYRAESRLKPGAEAFLHLLHSFGVPMAVTTATDRTLTEPALEHCGVLQLFDAVFTCEEVGKSKNEPDIFRQAMARLGSARESTWLFEDSLYSIRTAAADGFPTCGLADEATRFQENTIREAADCFLPSFIQWRQLPFAHRFE